MKEAVQGAPPGKQAHREERRITTTGLTVFPGTPLYGMVRSGEFTEATEKEKVEDLLFFIGHPGTAASF